MPIPSLDFDHQHIQKIIYMARNILRWRGRDTGEGYEWSDDMISLLFERPNSLTIAVAGEPRLIMSNEGYLLLFDAIPSVVLGGQSIEFDWIMHLVQIGINSSPPLPEIHSFH